VKCKLGSGFSVEYVTAGYGLTYRGIEKACQLHGLKTKVCRTHDELLTSLKAIPSNSSQAIITDGGLLRGFTALDNHAILLLCEKVDRVFRLFIIDSEANYYFHLNRDRKLLSEKIGIPELEIYNSQVVCQTQTEPVCYAFALHGAKLFEKEECFLKELRAGSSKESGVYHIKKLPEYFCVDSNEISKQAVNYQSELIEFVKSQKIH